MHSAFAQITSITTSPPLTGGNAQFGITFEAETFQKPLFIRGIGIPINSATPVPVSNVEVWYRLGGVQHIPGQPPIITPANGWILAGTTGGYTATGGGIIDSLPLNMLLPVIPGQRLGVFVHIPNLLFTDPTLIYTTLFDTLSVNDGTIRLHLGTNSGYGGTAPTPVNHPRGFTGNVYYEKSQLLDDAGVSAIESTPATLIVGSNILRARVNNYGINQITSVDVNWSINGVPQTPRSFTGLLDTIGGGASNALVTLDTILLSPNIQYEFKAWTSSPNFVTDTFRLNDTATRFYFSPLAGTYTIGQTLADYPSITAAVNALNQRGIDGPVRFILNSPSYTTATGEVFPINLTRPAGMSISNTVTFAPDSGLDVTIIGSAINLFNLDGGSYYRFDGRWGTTQDNRGLTVSNTATNGICFALRNDAISNIIRNCNIRGANTLTGTTGGLVTFFGSTRTIGNDSNLILNNYFGRSSTNVYAQAIVSAGQSALIQNNNNTIEGNWFNSFTWTCINIFATNNGNGSFWRILGNSFYDTTQSAQTGNYTAIFLQPGTGSASDSNYIENNFIGGTAPFAGGAPFGSPTNITRFFINVQSMPANATTFIRGNVIRNMNFNTVANTGTIVGINLGSGNAIIDSNIVDSISSIQNSQILGMQLTTTSQNVWVRGNTIRQINAFNVGTTVAVRGIVASGSASYQIHDNIVRGLRTNSTNTSTGGTGSAIFGIGLQSSGSNSTILRNHVGSIAEPIVFNTLGTSLHQVYGIGHFSGTALVADNIVEHIYMDSANSTTWSTSTSSLMNGILIGSVQTGSEVRRNTVRNLYLRSHIATHSSQLNGIGVFSSTPMLIDSNIVTSIFSSSTSTSTSTSAALNGINASGSGQMIITNNYIDSMALIRTTPTTGQINGIIYTGAANNHVANNTVANLYYNMTTSAPSIVGIQAANSVLNQVIENNRIYNLMNTNAAGTATGTIVGIQYNSLSVATGNNSFCNNNLIHSFTSVGTGATQLIGINTNSVGATLANNIIRLGLDSAGNAYTGPYLVYGLFQASFSNTIITRYYHNTIYIGGAPTTGSNTAATACLRSNTTTFLDVRNNIFVNLVANAGATSNNFCHNLAGNVAGSIYNYNILWTNTALANNFLTGGFTTNRKPLRGTAGINFNNLIELNSAHINPQLVNPTGPYTLMNFNLAASNPAEGQGDTTLIDMVPTDFGGNNRSLRTPVDIGAWSSATNTLSVDTIAPEVVITSTLLNTPNAANRMVTAVIADRSSGLGTGLFAPRLHYRKNLGTWVNVPGTLVSGSNTLGTWQFEIDHSLVGGIVLNDIIRYFVVAGDVAGNLNTAPAYGVGTAVDNITNPPNNPLQYQLSAPIATNITVGTGGDFTTLTATNGLFAAINNNFLQGNTTVTILPGTITEPGSIALNQWLELDMSNNVGNFGYSLTIRPSSATATILTSTANGPIITLNGADRVSILGYPSTGSASDTVLTIRNTNITFGQGVALQNDATNVLIDGVIFEGNNGTFTGDNAGLVCIRSTSLVTGNDNFVLRNSVLRRGGISTTPLQLFVASGTSGRENDNILIENNTFHDFAQNAIIFNFANGSNLVVKNNRIFQQSNTFSNSTMTAISMTPGTVSENDTIIGNIIGGNALDITSGYFVHRPTSAATFTGILAQVGTSNGVYIANNRIAYINRDTVTPSTFNAIQVGQGVSLIENNYIGDTLDVNNIISSGNAQMNGIVVTSGPSSIIRNNIIANLSNRNINGGTSIQLHGIRTSGQTASLQITNNLIMNLRDSSGSTGTTTAASLVGISNGSNTSATVIANNTIRNLENAHVSVTTSQVLGIVATSGFNTITNNLIENLSNRALSTGTLTSATLVGILNTSTVSSNQITTNNIVRSLTHQSGSNATSQVIGIALTGTVGTGRTITGNTVHSIRSNSSSVGIGTAASVIGILQSGALQNVNISNNTIHTIENTNIGSFANHVTGIVYVNSTSISNCFVNANRIYSVSSIGAAASRLIGIHHVSGSATQFSNNMIRLGIDSTGLPYSAPYEVLGILQNSTGVGPFRYLHNSIYLGGAPTSGTAITAGIRFDFAISQIHDIRNNIIVNAVNNTGSASGKNFCVRINDLPGVVTNLVSNHNMFWHTGTGGHIYGTTTVDYTNLTGPTGWNNAFGNRDLRSAFGNPQFLMPTGNVIDVDLSVAPSNPIEGAGDITVSAFVSTDAFGANRATLTPSDIGAHAGNFTISDDFFAPEITFTEINNQGNLFGPVAFNGVNIRDNGGIFLGALAPRLYYRKGAAGIYQNVAPIAISGTPTNATLDFEIDYNLIAPVNTGDTIFYFILAQDSIGNNIVSQAPGATALGVLSLTTPPANPNFYVLLPVIPAGTKFYVGTGQPYTSLTGTGGLFEFLNTQTIGGNITAVITSNIAELGTVPLNQLGEDGPGSGTFTLTICPDSSKTTAPVIISGVVNTATGMIPLNGADRVKISGIPDQSTDTTLRNMIFRNGSTSAPVIVMYNGATQNRLRNLIIEGNNTFGTTSTQQGLVLYAGSINSTGNSQDSITNCIIRHNAASTNIPQVLVGSYHTGTVLNSNNVMIGNEFAVSNSAHINAGLGTGTGWLVSNNSFYDNRAAFPNNAASTAIRFDAPLTTHGHTITNNFIGGSAANATGVTWTLTNAFSNWPHLFYNAANTTPSTISGNTFRRLRYNETGTSAYLINVLINAGSANVSNNMFGDSTFANSIELNTQTTNNGAVVVFNSCNGIVNIDNNRIANWTINAPGISSSASMINVQGGITSITNNRVGASTVPNSINTNANGQLFGIWVSTASAIAPQTIINNNTVANMTQTAVTTSLFGGIYHSGTTSPIINGNTVFNINGVSNNVNNFATSLALFGIMSGGSHTDFNASISNNTVYNINLNNTSSLTNHVAGINLGSLLNPTVSGNRIYNIRNLSTSVSQTPSATANGILIQTINGTALISNNQIALGNGETNNMQFNGIWQRGNSAHIVNTMYNTVVIGGTVTATGNNRSFAFHRGDNATFQVASISNVINNAFINTRTGGSSLNYAISNEVFGTPTITGINMNYNFLSTANAAQTALWGLSNSDINAWRTSSTMDRNSYSEVSTIVNPNSLFVDVATANLNVQTANSLNWYLNGKGIAGSASQSINTDYNNNTRGTNLGFGTDIGAHEFNSTAAVPAVTLSPAPALNGTSDVVFGNRTIATITWGGSGTVPTSVTASYFTGVNPPSIGITTEQWNAYLELNGTGGSGFIYDLSLMYEPALAGNVSSVAGTRLARQNIGWNVDASSSINTTTNRLNSATPIAVFGRFTGTDVTNPVPVTLIAFNGKANELNAVLTWTTVSETNNAGFEIERSIDGEQFEAIDFVRGNGTTTRTINYNYIDKGIFSSNQTVYYRLKQLDLDGKYNYSNVVVLSTDRVNMPTEIVVAPNPFTHSFGVQINVANASPATIEVFDLMGRKVFESNTKLNAGMQTINVNMPDNASQGVYFIKTHVNGATYTHKAVKTH
jgi:hypothetical protein